MNRKEFIGKVSRGAILGGIGFLIALFYKRDSITLYNECTGNLHCKACKSLSRCSLPEARKERTNDKG